MNLNYMIQESLPVAKNSEQTNDAHADFQDQYHISRNNYKVLCNDILQRSYDIEIEYQQLVECLYNVKEEIKFERLSLLHKRGFPQVLWKLCQDLSQPIALSEKQQNLAKSICVGSSTVAYFRPWSGRSRVEGNEITLLQKMIDRSLASSLKIESTVKDEKLFFKLVNNKINGNLARRNNKTFINPSLPHLSATPDGLIYQGADKIVGIVEIKSLKAEDQETYWKKANYKRRGLGVILRRETEEGHIMESIRPGHPWLAQIYLQMVVLRVKKAVLVLRVGNEWRQIEVPFCPNKAYCLVSNATRTYFTILKKLAKKTLSRKQIEFKSLKGRPKKSKRGRPKKILVEPPKMSNLEIDLD